MRYVLLIGLALLVTACGSSGLSSPADLPTLVPTPVPPPLPIAPDETVSGAIDDANPQDEYTFRAESDWRVSVEVFSGALSLQLFAPDGSIAAQGAIRDAAMPVDGSYVLRVTGETGDYALALRVEIPPTPLPPTETPLPATETPAPRDDLGTFIAAISSANPAFGAFNAADERHVYRFQGAAGNFVRLQMQRTSGTVDPVLTLYAPDGDAIATDDNGGGGRTALINGVRLPVDGIYSVQASGEGFTGTYELTLQTAIDAFAVTPVVEGSGALPGEPPTEIPVVLTPTLAPGVVGGLLRDHVTISDSIDRPGGFDRFSIAADAGETFSVGLLPDEGLDVRLDVISPTGAIAERAEQPGADGELVIPGYTAELTGTYIVIITGLNDTTGGYRLSYGRGITREEVRQAATVPDRTYNGNITRRAVRDVWFLRLNAGDLMTASVEKTSGSLDPYLEFVAPDGSILARNDNTDGSVNPTIQTARAPENGLYQLRVRAVEAQQTGTYDIVWRYIEAAPTPTPPLLVTDLFAVDDSLPENEFLYYPFQGNAGERVLIEVIAAPGSGFDPVVALLNGDGEPFAEDDDGGGNLNARLIAQIPADGIYQVRVGGYLSGGEFVLRVKRVY